MANVLIKDLTAKATPVDADVTILIDSAASDDNKKVTFGNIKAYIKAYTDTLYAAIGINGTVTSASVVTANGFAGTVATATTTPAITLTTSITGVLKGNGTAISAATASTDYTIPSDLYKLDNFSGNGVRNGFTITINADTTKIDIAAGVGYIIDNTTTPSTPVRTTVTYAGATAITLTNLATSVITYLAVNSSGTVIQQTTALTPTQRRTHIIIGAAIHSNLTVVNAINNLPDVVVDSSSQFNDLLDSLKNFNITGNIISANGANLNINKSTGEIFKRGVNFNTDTKDPHTIDLASLTAPTNIRYRLRDGTEYSNTAVIDPSNYDLAGVLTAVPANKFTIQRITLFTSNLIRIQYGQTVYNSLAEATQAISTETFVVESNIAANGLLRCALVVRQATTALNTAADATFFDTGKWGDIQTLASGGGTTTLQQAYNNSSDPEILTDATRGALSVKRGSAADTNNIYEGLNNAGTTTFSVTGNGVIYSASAFELGHATDTTLSRIAAGIVGFEGEVMNGFTSTATAAGTTTMDITYTNIQEFTGTTTQTVKLPTTSVVKGQQYIIQNTGTAGTSVVTVQSSGANTVLILGGGCTGIFTATQATPTTAAHWKFQKIGKNVITATSYTTDTGTSLNCDYWDTFIVSAQAGAIKLNNPTGTARLGQILKVSITGTAARAVTYDTQFLASTVALPATTVTTAQLNSIFEWNGASWVILGTS